MEPEEMRKQMEKSNSELVEILNRRMELSMRMKAMTEDVGDPEAGLIDQIDEKDLGKVRKTYADNILKCVVKETKSLHNKKFDLIGFHGEHGAFSEVAALKFKEDGLTIGHAEYIDIFDGVRSGQLDFGVVPIEHSLSGAADLIGHLLYKNNLKVIAEVRIPVNFCLMTLPDTDYREIKVVYSHRQAIAQCRDFLKRNHLVAKPYYDAAGAGMMLSKDRPAATAVIASELCARFYDLNIIKKNIKDRKQNYSRFLVLSKKESKNGGGKCSVIFSMEQKAGTLTNVLKLFSGADINLARIDSLAIMDEPGQYAFMLDFHGSDRDDNVKRVLVKVKKETTMYKFLGCYKEDNH